MADKRTVVGVFNTEEMAIRAIDKLHSLGYTKDEISILAEDPERFRRLDGDDDVDVETPKDVGKGAAAGAATGGIIGGLGALVAELGILAIPGVGPFLAAGPIAATVGGLLAGGAIGGAVGALVGLGIDKEEAKIYEQNLKDGDILVIVEADDNRYDNVRTTLSPHDYSPLDEDRRDRDSLLNREFEGVERRDTINEHIDRDRLGSPLDHDRNPLDRDLNRDRDLLGNDPDRDLLDRDPDRDGPSLKERLDRDNDGRLDLDDLRKNPRDTDDKL